MMIPQFLRFYSGYTVQSVLREYAITFFSLVNSMYRLQAQERLEEITVVATGFSGGKGSTVISQLEKSAKGLHGIVQEIRNLDKVKGK